MEVQASLTSIFLCQYGKDNNACWDHRCPGFVQVSPSVVLGGRIHPVSNYNGAQYEIHVHLFKVFL
jgi:hypothetical protein